MTTTLSLKLRNRLRPLLDRVDPGRGMRRRLIEGMARRRYSGLAIHPDERGNDWLADRIRQGAPFAAGKFGATESKTYYGWIKGHVPETTREELLVHSGLFPTDEETVAWFARLYFEAAATVDVLGVWWQLGERELIRDAGLEKRALLTGLTGLEPYFFPRPWSHGIAGKRVLVISPFAETILRQYERKDEVWPNGLLPDFHLDTLKFPHSKALADHSYESWRAILEAFKDKMAAKNFDIVLTGAGAATLPLATEGKRLGRQGIGMGGSLQVLFGIVGRRWAEDPFFSNLVNPAWTRPSGEEVPWGAKLMENGAYW
jgi:hypothetical protein